MSSAEVNRNVIQLRTEVRRLTTQVKNLTNDNNKVNSIIKHKNKIYFMRVRDLKI